ncbi:hypothetical protein HPO96_31640 [Kribbella sandramycini]|uniref:Uncharacterized protein n=1 Tax=Kribbella sandramycini TaxID=60450 RepID=A0A7Y4L5L1_9ACTN|nr:hypothetical protein [Kribbella sandramycini]MBB6567096.1 hypothetical protein [Kribbella sandramycini]NOL44814.1 hypothetical protein [Kribbella sandramycini]
MRTDRVIAVVTVAIGVLGAVAAQLGAAEADRTLALAATTALSIISIGLPFIGAQIGVRYRRTAAQPAYREAYVWALLLGAIGLAAALLIAVLIPSSSGDQWQYAPVIVLGAFVTQLVAQTTGIGLGVLLGRAWIAGVLTIVIPLGLYFALPESVRAFFAPYASAQLWWSGEFGLGDLLPFLVMVALWGPVLHFVAWSRTKSAVGASSR